MDMERLESIDTRTFERLVADHHEEVWRSARRVLRSDADALDAVQELFLRVLDGRLAIADDADASRTLRWWAVRIALNERRGARRRSEREASATAVARSTTEEAMDDRLDDAERNELWNQVEAMPDELRVPVVLRFAEGLGFARIAEALGVAESTAHDRVRKGLDHLRGALKGAGLAGLAVGVEVSLASGAPSAVPGGVRERLLELGANSTAAAAGGGATASVFGSGTLAWVLGVSLLVVGGLFAALYGHEDARIDAAHVGVDGNEEFVVAAAFGEEGVETSPSRVALGPSTSSRAPLAAAGADVRGDEAEDGEGDGLRATIRGTVVDAFGRPFPALDVAIESAERNGKRAAFEASGRTAQDGGFAIEVEAVDGGRTFGVGVSNGEFALRAGQVELDAGETVDLGSIEFADPRDQERGPFSIDLAIVDGGGLAVAEAFVEILSPEPVASPATLRGLARTSIGDERFIVEASLRADASGRVRHEGDVLGSKTIRVRPPSDAWAPTVRSVQVGVSDALGLAIELEPGRRVTGTIGIVDGVLTPELASGLRVHTIDPLTGRWIDARMDGAGGFEFTGLASCSHRLQFGCGAVDLRLSSGWLELVPPATGLEVALKREDDLRDVGVHGAELHGSVSRVEDGAPIEVGVWDLEVDRIVVEAGVDFERDQLPNLLFPRPVQRGLAGEPPTPSGVFHRTGLDGGTYLVRSLVGDRAAFVAGPFELGEREVRVGVAVELERAATLAGHIVGPEGETVDGAFVFVTGIGPYSDERIAAWSDEYRATGGRGFFWTNGSGRRSKDGGFELTRLPSTFDLRVVALHPEFEPVVGPVVRMESGATRDDVVLRFTTRRAD